MGGRIATHLAAREDIVEAYQLAGVQERASALGLMIYMLNPLVPLLEAFRWSLLGQGDMTSEHLLYATGMSVIVFVVGAVTFKRMEQRFADFATHAGRRALRRACRLLAEGSRRTRRAARRRAGRRPHRARRSARGVPHVAAGLPGGAPVR